MKGAVKEPWQFSRKISLIQLDTYKVSDTGSTPASPPKFSIGDYQSHPMKS